jgi:transcriptional regulator with XRE-family HTH domain
MLSRKETALRLKACRVLIAKTQQHFATALNTTEYRMNQIESEEQALTIEDLSLMEEKFGINHDFFFQYTAPVFLAQTELNSKQKTKI